MNGRNTEAVETLQWTFVTSMWELLIGSIEVLHYTSLRKRRPNEIPSLRHTLLADVPDFSERYSALTE